MRGGNLSGSEGEEDKIARSIGVVRGRGVAALVSSIAV